MIFCFSGTGNSLYVAQKLCESEEIIDMPDAMDKKRFKYEVKDQPLPAKAIQYRNPTKKRGRYVNPNVKFSNM